MPSSRTLKNIKLEIDRENRALIAIVGGEDRTDTFLNGPRHVVVDAKEVGPDKFVVQRIVIGDERKVSLILDWIEEAKSAALTEWYDDDTVYEIDHEAL